MTRLQIKELFSRPGTPAYPFRDNKGQLCWLEPITEQGGRLALKQQVAAGERIITPPGFQIRSRVHEYGGKCFCFVADRIYFNNYADGLIYRQPLHMDRPPVAVVKPTNRPSSYADLHYSRALNAVIAVQEIEGDSAAQNQNQLVAISLDPSESLSPQVLVSGADFYAAPCLSEAGDKLAWLQWDHPDMPWDSSYLVLADISFVDDIFSVDNKQPVAGDKSTSVCQPGFVRNGDLVFAMDQDDNSGGALNYWNLYRSDGDSVFAITQDQAEYGEAHWVFGQRRWVQTCESGVLAIATRDEVDQLFEIDLRSGVKRSVGEACAGLSQLAEAGGVVTCMAEYTDKPAQIIEILPEGESNTLSESVPWLAETDVVQAHKICYPTSDEKWAYANFYAANTPTSGQTTGLMVLVHGGPTSRSSTALSPLVQYFAQIGFSVLDVNHRGSTGHGRAFRQALLCEWGETDVNDIADAIKFVISERGIDAQRVFVRGGSAGGYAVLRALTRFPELFCGGACYYGIGNLITLAEITHKFEGSYTDRLIGEPYTPESAALPESRFRSRSPIFDIDKISSPLILFQGLEDRVVPPEVSREMVQTLALNGVVHEYVEYPGEGHGFRKAETKIDALSREVAFYRKILNPE